MSKLESAVAVSGRIYLADWYMQPLHPSALVQSRRRARRGVQSACLERQLRTHDGPQEPARAHVVSGRGGGSHCQRAQPAAGPVQ